MKRIRNWSEDDFLLNEQSTTLTAQLHGLECPSCGSRKYVKYGNSKGNQRYKCSKCEKHFRSTTGKTIHHLHLKPKIQAYIDCMHEGLSLRKTAKKIDISLRTAFRWRHRFLSAMHNQTRIEQKESKVFSAYVLPFSHKGTKEDRKSPKVTSIIQLDVTQQIAIQVVGRYGQTASKLVQSLQGEIAHLPCRHLPRLYRQNTSKSIPTERVASLRNIHGAITDWLHKFRGVSSKYLEHYWAWFTINWQSRIKNSEQRKYMYQCF